MRSHRLAAALAALSLVAAARPAAAAERVRVVLLPIVVHTLENADHLRDGLGDMLAARLGRYPQLVVLRVGDAAAATTDADAARAAALPLEADYVLFGSFTHFGRGASLDLQCLSVREEGTRHLFLESGALGEIIPKLDPLAERVLRHVTGQGTEPGPGARPAKAASRGEIDDLRRRVEALERALAAERAAVAGGAGAQPPPETDRGGAAVR